MKNSSKMKAASRAQPSDAGRFLPLPNATLHILLALRDGEKHGYAIMRYVEELSEGTVILGPGTLYGAIKRLLADGLVDEVTERPDPQMDDERRRYYRLTGLGEAVCAAELERLKKLLARTGRRLLSPAPLRAL